MVRNAFVVAPETEKKRQTVKPCLFLAFLLQLLPTSNVAESSSIKVLRGVSKDGEFRNWAATVQTSPAKVFRPESAEDVKELLGKVWNYQ